MSDSPKTCSVVKSLSDPLRSVHHTKFLKGSWYSEGRGPGRESVLCTLPRCYLGPPVLDNVPRVPKRVHTLTQSPSLLLYRYSGRLVTSIVVHARDRRSSAPDLICICRYIHVHYIAKHLITASLVMPQRPTSQLDNSCCSFFRNNPTACCPHGNDDG